MHHFWLFRALIGGAGLAACVGLLAGQARADIVEFVPVRSADPVALAQTGNPPSAHRLSGATALLAAKSTPRAANRHEMGCKDQRIAMAAPKTRAPD